MNERGPLSGLNSILILAPVNENGSQSLTLFVTSQLRLALKVLIVIFRGQTPAMYFSLALAVWLGTAAAPATAASVEEHSLESGGATRSYLLFIPEQASATTKVPLVIVLHGGSGTAESAQRMTEFTRKAQLHGFIVVYPNGSGRRNKPMLTWNAGHCCGYAMKKAVPIRVNSGRKRTTANQNHSNPPKQMDG